MTGEFRTAPAYAPAWRAAIQEILGGSVTPEHLTALSLALGALRSDLERRHLGLPTG